MAALTAARDTKREGFDAITPQTPKPFPLKAAAKVYAGGVVAVDATGYLVPATAAAALKVVGVAEKSADNTSGANGALSVPVRRGAFWLANKGGDLLTQADVYNTQPSIEDDQTVRKTAAGSSVFGRLIAVDSTLGCLVEIS
jgi:hypothetical protein